MPFGEVVVDLFGSEERTAQSWPRAHICISFRWTGPAGLDAIHEEAMSVPPATEERWISEVGFRLGNRGE